MTWIEAAGLGYYPVDPSSTPYDAAYFEKYRGYAATRLGHELNEARLRMVRRHYPDGEPLVDVGIGCGQFVESRHGTFGFDVNPAGVAWLAERDLFVDVLAGGLISAATFWDSLEHIENPSHVLSRIERFAFVALPIFRDLPHVLASKHFRPDEHYWYFTRAGFVAFMDAHGFALIGHNSAETLLGREDVESFAFERRS